VALVLDTNIVLDLLVFDDPATGALQAGLRDDSLAWRVTGAMRLELERVLAYPLIAVRLAASGRALVDVLAQFDRLSRLAPDAAAAPVRCSDRDDQIFVDLAVAHRAVLISKDRQVLRLRKRLALLGVTVQASAVMPCVRGDRGQCAGLHFLDQSNPEDPR
jgi:putative PIN family toxin of toxin-antitoxin system